MDKRVVSLGVHKKKLKKHVKKKGLLNKVVDYLMSDTYMFAPLLSSQPSDFLPPNTFPTSPTGVETMRASEEKNKKLLKKVGEYLKSDYYMYAPLIGPKLSHVFYANTASPSSGPVWHLKRVTTAVSTGKITKKTNEPTKHTLKIIEDDQPSDNSLIKSSTVVRQTLSHRETVKRMVNQNCRLSSVPGKGVLETKSRKLVVE